MLKLLHPKHLALRGIGWKYDNYELLNTDDDQNRENQEHFDFLFSTAKKINSLINPILFLLFSFIENLSNWNI